MSPTPRLGDVVVGRDAVGRVLRVSAHPSSDRVVLSIWQDGRCLATLRLAGDDVPVLVQALTGATELLTLPVPARVSDVVSAVGPDGLRIPAFAEAARLSQPLPPAQVAPTSPPAPASQPVPTSQPVPVVAAAVARGLVPPADGPGQDTVPMPGVRPVGATRPGPDRGEADRTAPDRGEADRTAPDRTAPDRTAPDLVGGPTLDLGLLIEPPVTGQLQRPE